MKNLLFVALTVLLTFSTQAQTEETFDDSVEQIMKIDQMPEYKGGVVKLYKYLTQKIVYPREAREKGIEGKVYVQFIITETGAIEDNNVIRGIGYGCDEEVVRLVSAMKRWKPARQDGKAVKVLYTLPVNFTLN